MRKQLNNHEEAELLKKFRNKATKHTAFVECLGFFQVPIYWHIRRIVISHADADDLSQNTFIKVWEKIDDFRADSKLYTWIYSIATNEALQFLKRKKQLQSLHAEENDLYLLNTLKTDPYFNGNQLQQSLQEAILSLPEKQRLVFNMKYHENLKYEEISEILQTSVGALKASYHHAVKKIELFIQKKLS